MAATESNTTIFTRMRNYRPDPLIVLILLAVVIAIFLPARGEFADGFGLATTLAIAFLFFLYGARLSPEEAKQGFKHWRLHLIILVFTFLVFPVLGLAMKGLEPIVGPEMYLGLLYMTLVPSTVQSSVAFTSIARGNVAGAIVSASASNLLGVVLTPVLVMLLMSSSSGLVISGQVFLDVAIQLLLPFVVGQLSRKWTAKFASNSLTKQFDRISIAMVVYAAFSEGVVDGIWVSVPIWQLLFVCVLSVVLVAFMLWLTRYSAMKLGFNRGDQIAIEFCGTKKSLATGLPMAAVIFAGQSLGLIILPLMLFHQIQLMMCSWLAARYAKQYALAHPEEQPAA